MSHSFNKHLVIQSDFGIDDGAVAAMAGVIVNVDDSIRIHHLTHNIPPYNIYLASYRLYQTYTYWPKGTIFVSIVDPGVGYEQKSLVVLLKSGHYIVTPDNGTVTHLAKYVGIDSIYEIDKEKNLLPSTNKSYTFYGRDLYTYTAARLTSEVIELEEVGNTLSLDEIALFDIQDYEVVDNHTVKGHIAIHDERYGSLWTNIPYDILNDLQIKNNKLRVKIEHNGSVLFNDELTTGQSFQSVSINQPIVYCNSLQNIGVALNQNSFANAFKIDYGLDWDISFYTVE